MTIKNRGGVFGRNPTFNDVDVDGTLSIAGAAVPAPADTLVSSDIGSTVQAYDADTAKLDLAQTFTQNQIFNGTVGVGTTSASKKFVVSNSGQAGLEIDPFTRSATEGTSLLSYNRDTSSFVRADYDALNHVFFASTSEKARITSDGITFNGDTAAANALSDYEEGVWTPVIIGGTTAGTGTYSQQDGVYTKVGNLVTVSCYLAFTAHTGTGHMKVSGLPFAGVGSSVDFQAGATQAQYINAGTSATQLAASVVTTASNISLYGFVNNAAKVATQVNASGSGSQLAITLTYRTS